MKFRTASALHLTQVLFLVVLTISMACISLVPIAMAADQANTKTFDIQISKRDVISESGGTLKLNEGDTVKINWTTDEKADLHLHGYDIHTVAEPDKTITMIFKAHTAGRFPITAHNFKHKTLIYLEVYPK